MPIDLYHTPGSGPCRIVLLTGAALELSFNLHVVNLTDRDQFKPEYLKLNPQHTVPTLVEEDGFVLWESRTIAKYLVCKYGKGSSLYPDDIKTRALIDQRIDFDAGTLYPRFALYYYTQLFAGEPADEGRLSKLHESLAMLNRFLDGQTYLIGNSLTLADLTLVATVSSIDYAEISLDKYPNVLKWYTLVQKTAPSYKEANVQGLEIFQDTVRKIRASKGM